MRKTNAAFHSVSNKKYIPNISRLSYSLRIKTIFAKKRYFATNISQNHLKEHMALKHITKWIRNANKTDVTAQTFLVFLPAVETWFWHFILTWWLFNWKGSAYLCFEIQLHNFMLHYVAVVNSFPRGNFCNCFNPSFPPT